MTTVKQAGKKGGSVKSEAKTRAARANASKPRGKWVTAIYAEWADANGREHSTLVIAKGQCKNHGPDELLSEVEKREMAQKYPIDDLHTLTAVSERLVL